MEIARRAFTIAAAASVSDAGPVEGATPLGLFMPAAWTAAGLTFQHSLDGTTWADVYDADGTEVALVVAASRYVAFRPSLLLTLGPWLRLRSGTAAAPVAQGAQAIVTLLYRQFD